MHSFILWVLALFIASVSYANDQNAKVEVYSSENCTWCTSVKNLFKEMNIRYTEYDVVKDPARFRELKKKGHSTVPQIFINGEHIGGYMSVAWMSEETLKAKLKDAALKARAADTQALETTKIKPVSITSK